MEDKISKKRMNNWKVPFFTIWAGQAASLLGSQLVQFALIWWLTKTTGSATVLATATLVGLLPQVVLGPVIGALVDRWNRRVIMIVADSVIAMATVALAILFLTGNVQYWYVYLLMFIRGAAGGFHWPAMQASTSLMVPKEHLTRIQGINQILHGALNIASAPLGALLLELIPIQGILAVDVGTALLAITPLIFIPIPQPQRTDLSQIGMSRTSIWQDMLAGFRYIKGWPGLIMVGIMAAMINFLLTPASSLIPIFVTQHFTGGAFHLAGLESAWGIGVIIGGILLGIWGGFKQRILTTLAGLIILGITVTMMGLLPSWAFYVAIALMFVIGFSNPITNGPLFAVMQSSVAPEMQGRVFTLVASVAAAMSPIGLLVAGPLADRFGVQTWYIAAGLLTLFMGVSGFFIPVIVNIEGERGENPDSQNIRLEGSPVSAGGLAEAD
jgi:DHA3 family macrolide efflux protein-like MFS transporter